MWSDREGDDDVEEVGRGDEAEEGEVNSEAEEPDKDKGEEEASCKSHLKPHVHLNMHLLSTHRTLTARQGRSLTAGAEKEIEDGTDVSKLHRENVVGKLTNSESFQEVQMAEVS